MTPKDSSCQSDSSSQLLQKLIPSQQKKLDSFKHSDSPRARGDQHRKSLSHICAMSQLILCSHSPEKGDVQDPSRGQRAERGKQGPV